MTDALKLLPPLKWRGKEYPVTERSVVFAHENSSHKLQFKNGAFVDMTGAQNVTYRYTIPMREDIGIARYKDLFSKGLSGLLNSILLRTPGELVDPYYGIQRCVPASYDEVTDVNKRDGVDVRIELQRAPELDEALEVDQPKGLDDLVGNAYDMDAEIAKVDWQQVPSPGPLVSLLGLATGIVAQTAQRRNQLLATAEDFQFRMKKLDNAVDDLTDPKAWPLKQAARDTWAAAVGLRKKSEQPGRRVIAISKAHTIGVTSLAAQVGMSVDELLKLNPSLARSPSVKAGTIVYVYQQVS